MKTHNGRNVNGDDIYVKEYIQVNKQGMANKEYSNQGESEIEIDREIVTV